VGFIRLSINEQAERRKAIKCHAWSNNDINNVMNARAENKSSEISHLISQNNWQETPGKRR